MKIYQVLEKIPRFYQKKPKSIVSCYQTKNCVRNYTTHQFTYFIYLLFEDKFKNPKMMKIQQVHQKIHTKQFLIFNLYCFLI